MTPSKSLDFNTCWHIKKSKIEQTFVANRFLTRKIKSRLFIKEKIKSKRWHDKKKHSEAISGINYYKCIFHVKYRKMAKGSQLEYARFHMAHTLNSASLVGNQTNQFDRHQLIFTN